jgi:phosphotransferase system  glucose/maltose/N-acetylglucosamine-specific IIC component
VLNSFDHRSEYLMFTIGIVFALIAMLIFCFLYSNPKDLDLIIEVEEELKIIQ